MTKAGSIEVICGPMYSGKSEELIRRLTRAQIANRPFQLFKPSIDDRYSKTNVISHSGIGMPCLVVQSAIDIYDRASTTPSIIAIDEVQFFTEDLVEILEELSGRGHRVIVAGLDLDSNGQPFGPMPALLAVAETVTKLTAVCQVCGEHATRTYRTSTSKEQILVGAKDDYEARCRQHFMDDTVGAALPVGQLSFFVNIDQQQ